MPECHVAVAGEDSLPAPEGWLDPVSCHPPLPVDDSLYPPQPPPDQHLRPLVTLPLGPLVVDPVVADVAPHAQAYPVPHLRPRVYQFVFGTVDGR